MNRLDIAIEAAKKGANHALTYYRQNVKVDLKADLTPVTIADRESEEIIKKYILEKDPQAKFVGEESGGDIHQDSFWLIDPIDGTIFFTRDIPFWGTLVTYIENGQATVGVSYIPLLDELLYAQKSKGAFLNGKQAHVSSISNIAESFFTHGSVHRFVGKLPGFISLGKKAHKMKGISESYQYHLLASGRSEGAFDGNASPWDIAGMKLIIEEAGGKVTDFYGNPWTIEHKDAIMTNGKIHEEVLRIVHEK